MDVILGGSQPSGAGETTDGKAVATSGEEQDLYLRVKAAEKQLEFITIQEEYIKDEIKNLKRETIRAKEEIKRIQAVPLQIGQFVEMVDEHYGVIQSGNSTSLVRVLSTIDRELLKTNATVSTHRHSHA
ncbi:RPT3, partial [Symbiodinium sp. KB8]